MRKTPASIFFALGLGLPLFVGCGSSDGNAPPAAEGPTNGVAGTGGGAGAALGGAAGNAGTGTSGASGHGAGMGGSTGGGAGTGGAAGGNAGSSGASGAAGNATAGAAGTAGTSGAAGFAGSGGTPANAGSGGASNVGGSNGGNAGSGGASNVGGSSGGAGSSGASGTAGTSAAGAGGASGSGGAGGSVCGPIAVAIETLDFGDGNSGEWKSVGFDIDGKTTTAASTDVCQPSSGGSPSVAYPDGNNGIDNSFGKNVLPMLLSIDPSFVADVQNDIANGSFTTLFEVTCLPPTGDAQMLTTKVFDGIGLGMPPVWDGSDAWPVKPELLMDPTDPQSSTLLFANGSLTGTTFDAGTNGTIVLSLPMQTLGASTELRLTIHAARMTMTLASDQKSATAGRIGGVLDTEELVTEIEKVAALIGACNTPTLDALITQVRQSSDILADGTQDPTVTCNGISIGLGFTASAAQIGSVGAATPPGMTCP